MERSIRDSVEGSSSPAFIEFPAPSAARRFLMEVRRRVRLARLTPVPRAACRMALSTDFLRGLRLARITVAMALFLQNRNPPTINELGLPVNWP